MEYNKDNTRRRPMEVTEEHFASEWDRIFGKSKDKIDTTKTTGVNEMKYKAE